MLSRPLVQFNIPADQLAAFVMRYRDEFVRLPAAQQVDHGFVPIDASSSSAAGPKRRQDQPARAGGKRKQLPTAPFSSAAVVQALPAPVPPSDRQGRDAAEQSSEATNYDDGAVRYRAGTQHRSKGGAGAFEECEGQDGEGGGSDGEGGGEEGEGGGEEEEGGGEEDDSNEGDAEENIVRGIESAIESSISADPGVWDRPELVLAPVDPNVIVGGQGRRITPDEFFQRDSAEFDWYVVCGQHTVEAMKRLVRKDSPAVKVYGLRTYSKVRVVFFDDDHTRGYFNVSLFDNTQENRAMMLSFQDVVCDMREWWIDNNRIEAPKAKVSKKDAVAVAHQKTWQNFLRACMGKACDKAFVKQTLDNEYNKDWSNKLRGYLNLATFTRTVWPLVEKFFAMFEEDGPKGSTVSWKDLCPTYFKNFGDMTCREREVVLLLLMSGKVVATKVRVTPPRVNIECLLDIMRKERYMVRMFNYVVFRAEGRAGDEWNDDFFMSYKDLEERYASNGLCADEWEKQREKLHSNLVKTIPRRLEGVEEARQGAGLGPTEVMYKEAPFHFKVFIYTTIDKLDMLRAEVKRIASCARHLVWDKLSRPTILLPVCMRSKEVMAASVDINVQSDVLHQLYRWEDIELIPGSWKRVDRPPSDVTRYDNIATSSRDLMAIVLDAEGGDLKKVTVAPRLHNDLTEVHVVEEKFRKCLGKHGGVEGDESAAYSIWEREPGKLRKLCGSFVGEAEAVLLLGRAHVSLVWKLLLAGNNAIACDESAKDIAYLTKFVDILVKDGRFECRLEKPRAPHRTNRDMYHKLGPKRLKVWEYMFRDAPDGRLDGGYIYRKAKVTEALKHYHSALIGAFETFVARYEILRFDLHKDKLTFKNYVDLAKSGKGFNPVDSEEDSSDSDLEIEKDTNATGWCGKSAAMEHNVKGYGPGQSEGCSNLPPAKSVASGVDRVVCTHVEDDEDDDLDIPAQPTKKVPGDPIPPRFCADANNVYFLDDKYACTSEDKWGHDIIWHDGIFEPCIQGGKWKMAVTYVERAAALESMDVDSQEDAAPVPEASTWNTMSEQREDGGTTFGVKPPLPEAGNTPVGKNTIGSISVATGDTSQGEKVSLDKPADAGATYGSLLATGVALAGTSEMVSESTAGMGVTGMSLHPPTCTSKGYAHCTTTPQGRVTGDNRNGGNAGGSPRSRNIEDMTTDDEDGVEGGKGVSDPTRAENEG
ncbi:hypothetical protein CBR_g45953 [Chara braunii]|uniref:Uncharacterized protein n=1 Tax=Chara braunii TaxID=69332 RepID=A0A388LZQ8_CHABU|nr:hypothetical protein CBR_g45953 [Chara braunii]|eukprot:GBG87797.1 hypothetical protein CBR_g45953 [Chara braunii]